MDYNSASYFHRTFWNWGREERIPLDESTQEYSGLWAHELRPRPKSSTLPIPEMCSILVSCRRTRSQQRVWFYVGNASRPFGSGHKDLARGRERKLKMKTRIVALAPDPQRHAAGFQVRGGSRR